MYLVFQSNCYGTNYFFGWVDEGLDIRGQVPYLVEIFLRPP